MRISVKLETQARRQGKRDNANIRCVFSTELDDLAPDETAAELEILKDEDEGRRKLAVLA